MSSFDTLFDSLPGNGWLEKDEAELLLRSANSTQGIILEVGCYHGRSTVLLASLGRSVISVDCFEKFDTDDPEGNTIQARFLENLQERDIHNVTLYRQRIEDWKKASVGFAYLDGDHTYQGTRNQLAVAIACRPMEICVHDYDIRGDGLDIKRAVDECSGLRVVDVKQTLARCKVQCSKL